MNPTKTLKTPTQGANTTTTLQTKIPVRKLIYSVWVANSNNDLPIKEGTGLRKRSVLFNKKHLHVLKLHQLPNSTGTGTAFTVQAVTVEKKTNLLY